MLLEARCTFTDAAQVRRNQLAHGSQVTHEQFVLQEILPHCGTTRQEVFLSNIHAIDFTCIASGL